MNPENTPENRRRLGREIRDALKTGGMHITNQAIVDQLIDVVVAETTELRSRIANRIVTVIADRGGNITPEHMERLSFIILRHYEDEKGEIQLAFGNEDDSEASD